MTTRRHRRHSGVRHDQSRARGCSRRFDGRRQALSIERLFLVGELGGEAACLQLWAVILASEGKEGESEKG